MSRSVNSSKLIKQIKSKKKSTNFIWVLLLELLKKIKCLKEENQEYLKLLKIQESQLLTV